jgi:hypothetical protein
LTLALERSTAIGDRNLRAEQLGNLANGSSLSAVRELLVSRRRPRYRVRVGGEPWAAPRRTPVEPGDLCCGSAAIRRR